MPENLERGHGSRASWRDGWAHLGIFTRPAPGNHCGQVNAIADMHGWTLGSVQLAEHGACRRSLVNRFCRRCLLLGWRLLGRSWGLNGHDYRLEL